MSSEQSKLDQLQKVDEFFKQFMDVILHRADKVEAILQRTEELEKSHNKFKEAAARLKTETQIYQYCAISSVKA